MITLEIITNNFYVLGFDLTPDREDDEQRISLPLKGNVRIGATLKKAAPWNCDMNFFAEFPGYIEID